MISGQPSQKNNGTNRLKTFIFQYNQVYLGYKSKQSIDMAGPCSILMDFDYTKAKLCKIRPFSWYFCLSHHALCSEKILTNNILLWYCDWYAEERMILSLCMETVLGSSYLGNSLCSLVPHSGLLSWDLSCGLSSLKAWHNNFTILKKYLAVCASSRRGLFFLQKKLFSVKLWYLNPPPEV